MPYSVGWHPMNKFNRRERGVALVLVLSLAAVLGLLVLQLALTAKSQATRAQSLIDRAEADLVARSASADLSFALLTQPWVERDSDKFNNETATTLPEVWNFRSDEFSLKGVNFSIQDVAGLLPLPRRGESPRPLVALMEQVGIDRQRAEAAGSAAYQYQLDPNNLPLQDVYQLGQLAGLTAPELERLAPLVTVVPSFTFNPGTAPIPVLKTRYEGSVLEGLLALRAEAGLDAAGYASVLGIGGDEFIEFYPGPALRWQVVAEFGDARSVVESTVLIRPYEFEPFLPWSQRRVASAREAT
jgi:type II secretory pathway component PulK